MSDSNYLTPLYRRNTVALRLASRFLSLSRAFATCQRELHDHQQRTPSEANELPSRLSTLLSG